MNMQALMKQVQAMQKDIASAQKEINESEFVGKNGLVEVTMMGTKQVVGVKIQNDEEIKEDLSILEDMIALAVNDAMKKINQKTEEKMGKYANMMPGMF